MPRVKNGDLVAATQSGQPNKDVRELILVFGTFPTPRVAFTFEHTFFMEGARVPDRDNTQFGFQAVVQC